MKKRLKEMEEEAAALRDMQAKVEKEMSAVQGESQVPGSCPCDGRNRFADFSSPKQICLDARDVQV
jgi:hypothetical protein